MAAASRSTRIPNFPNKSALEVIMTTLHAGGKFDPARSTRPPAACMASAFPWSTRFRSGWRSRSARGGQLYARSSSAASRKAKLEKLGRVAQPARHHGPLQARSRRSSARRRLQAGAACSGWRAPRPICSAASRSAGVATRRCFTASRTRPPRRPSTFPAA